MAAHLIFPPLSLVVLALLLGFQVLLILVFRVRLSLGDHPLPLPPPLDQGGSRLFFCREEEREALLLFKQGLHDPANRLSTWLATGGDCCGWAGVGCDNRTGHVVKLDLRNPHPFVEDDEQRADKRALGGEIGSPLLGLKHLAHLDLSMNDFGGKTIPEFMGSLRRLRYLNLSRSGLGGPIPHHLGNLSRLQYLDLNFDPALRYNNMVHTLKVADAGWISRLSSLRHLNMQNVDIAWGSNWLEALSMLPSISLVNLRGCYIRRLPPPPPPHMMNLTSLTFLDLSRNYFDSPLPKWLANFTRLEYLGLSWNGFRGRIPSEIGSQLSSLKVLRLSGNPLLEGGLPRSFRHLCKLQRLELAFINISSKFDEFVVESLSRCITNNLRYLDLSNTLLSGILPADLFNGGDLEKLEYLDLSLNSLKGRIPSSLGGLSSLKTLNLFENNLAGVIPDSLGGLWQLQNLVLRSNLLEGPIPSSLGRLSSLESLLLRNNHLVGAIPESLGRLSSLKALDLHNNSLLGAIPESLGRLSSLKELDLHNNSLLGVIPESLGGLSLLEYLDLSSNGLEGTITEAHFTNLTSLHTLEMGSNHRLVFNISPDWLPPFRLRYVQMASCKLGPRFPTWLKLDEIVYQLNLSGSGISDTLPDSYWSSTYSIHDLDLSNNEIKGKIPNSLKNTTIVSVATLKSNQIEGQVPLFFSSEAGQGLGIGFALDLSNNLLSAGPIPRNISSEAGQKLVLTYALDLSNNSLYGPIPPLLCQLEGLVVLDLSRNNLSGNIPSPLCQFKYLNVLDLSRNNLSGNILHFWKNCPELSVLNLAHNGLVGDISSSLSFPSSLLSLHMEDNNLSGEFPPSLRNCPRLRVLDLGENRFSGVIPSWVAGSLPSLQILRLRSNMFTGNIPASLSAVATLHVIDLANNKLTGNIPDDFGNLSAMKYVRKEGALVDFDFLYTESLELVTKGPQVYYERLLQLVISIDLSNNKLSGNIPQGLANLLGLQYLNVSGNQITGEIIHNIGTLRWLETLDLSRNNLSGRIPSVMSNLTSLSHLNLSFNNFSGRIPTGNQLDTFREYPSIYMGNPYLCGIPLETACEGDPTETPTIKDHKDGSHDEDYDTIWFWLSVALGFISGFWLVCGTLFFKDKWRYAYFQLIDSICDRFIVLVKVNLRKLRYNSEE